MQLKPSIGNYITTTACYPQYMYDRHLKIGPLNCRLIGSKVIAYRNALQPLMWLIGVLSFLLIKTYHLLMNDRAFLLFTNKKLPSDDK